MRVEASARALLRLSTGERRLDNGSRHATREVIPSATQPRIPPGTLERAGSEDFARGEIRISARRGASAAHRGDIIVEVAARLPTPAGERQPAPDVAEQALLANRHRAVALPPCSGAAEHRRLVQRPSRRNRDDTSERAWSKACRLRAREHDDALGGL